MDNVKSTGKFEIIEQALQEAVGGGVEPIDACAVTCSVFSMDVCNIDLCTVRPQLQRK